MVLSTITWDSTNQPTGGSWDTPGNWIGGQVPGPGDDAVINLTAAGTVTLSTNVTDSVHSLTANANTGISIGSDTLTLASTSTIGGDLALSNGTLNGAGPVNVGQLDWSNAFLGSTVTTTKGGTISSPNAKYLEGTLINAGTLTWTGGTINSYADGASIVNQSGATFAIQSDSSISVFAGSMTVTNAGTITKSVTNGTTTIQVPFNDTGAVNVQTGTFAASGGGTTTSATINARPGATYDLTGGGTDTYAGTITGSGGGTVLLQNGTLTTPNGGATFNFSTGLLQWTGGVLGGSVTNAGSLTISGTNAVYLAGTLTNAGTLTWTGSGTINSYVDGSTIVNQSGATFAIQSDSSISVYAGSMTVTNAGTITKSATTGTTTIQVPFNDTGTVNVQTGTFAASGGGTTTSATINAQAGATYDLTGGGTDTYAGTITGSGGGTVLLRNGTVTTPGTGATFSYPAGMLQWTGGVLGGSVTNAGSLTISGTNAVYLAGTLTNAGTLTWTGSGTINSYANGTMIVNQPGATFAIQSDSSISVYAGSMTVTNAGTITKSATTGTTTIQVPFNDTGTVNVQAGTLAASGGGTTTSATINAQAGATYDLTGGGTDTYAGTITGSGGGTVLLRNGTLTTVAAGATFNYPAGMLQWASGFLAGSVTNAGSLTISGSDAKYLEGTLINAGTLTWTGSGTINSYANGTMIVNQPGATFAIQSDSSISVYVGSMTVTNAGTITKSATNGTTTIQVPFSNSGLVQVSTGTINLQGGFSNFASNTLTGGSYVVAGTLQFTGADLVTNAANVTLIGSGSMIVDNGNNDALRDFATNAAAGIFSIQGGRNVTTPGAFANAGSLNVGSGSTFTSTGAYTQSGGSTNLVGGGVLASTTSNVTINGGLLGGSGTVVGNLTNASGNVDPGGAGTAGVLNVTGNYFQGSGGTLNIDLGGTIPGTQYDVLAVAGSATLAGTLNVGLIGGFVPANTNSFQVLTYASTSSTFTTVNLNGLPGYLKFTTTYNPTNVTIAVAAATLAVTSFAPTTTGFAAIFDEPFNLAPLNLYTTATAGFGPADVTVVGASTGPVAGSLVVNPGNQAITFLKTGGVLAPDTYTVTFRSASNGFTDTSGGLLDGNGDGTPGDDYTTTFTVAPSSARVVSLPDFARGPGQAVVIPAATGSGLPLTISDGTNVTSISLTLTYDPTLLSITGANLGASAPAGSSVTINTSTPGLALLTFTSPTALPTGPGTFATLVASVPNAAPYASKEALVLSSIALNGGAIAATDQDGVHVVAYLGDTTGNGGYSSFDATLVRQVVANISTGFAAYPLLDPRIVGDIAGFGTLSGIDATYITQYVANIPQPRIPALPGVTIVAGGPDPLIWLPQDLTASPGSTLSVPVLFRQTNGSPIGLDAAALAIEFDPGLFVVTGIRLGDVTGGFTLVESFDNATGEIIASERSASGALVLAPGTQGALLWVDLMVRPGADLGSARINLLGEGRVGSAVVYTSLNDGGLTLVPAPSDSDLDPVDGIITVTPPTAAPAPVAPASGAPVVASLAASAVDRAIESSFGEGVAVATAGPTPADPVVGVLIPWAGGEPSPLDEPVSVAPAKKAGAGRVLLGLATPGGAGFGR